MPMECQVLKKIKTNTNTTTEIEWESIKCKKTKEEEGKQQEITYGHESQ